MAKRGKVSGMTPPEKVLGGMVLAAYLFLLSLAAGPLYDLIERTFSVTLDANLRAALHEYILFGLTAVIFGRYLLQEGRMFLDHAGSALCAVGISLVIFYGLNELLSRLLRLLSLSQPNLNDQAIISRLAASPRSTVLILVMLSPIVEETLFRGYVFGNLRPYNRAGAYIISCVLFALPHVWPFFSGGWDFSCLSAMVQYLIPGAIFAWTFERSGSLWGSILLHGTVNALAVWISA